MLGMQTNAYLASRQLTRGYLVIAMFIFAVIKHCHYDKSVNVIKACEEPGCRVTEVYVALRKVND